MLVFLGHESVRKTTKDGFTVVCIDTTLDRMVGYTRPFLRLLFTFALHFKLSFNLQIYNGESLECHIQKL